MFIRLKKEFERWSPIDCLQVELKLRNVEIKRLRFDSRNLRSGPVHTLFTVLISFACDPKFKQRSGGPDFLKWMKSRLLE